jgi:multiple sugar transport system substrate-binding protein
MRKALSSIYILILIFSLITACSGKGTGSNSETNTNSGKKVTITYWNGYTGSDRPALEAVVKKFNDTHDNIQVKMDIMPWDVMFQKLTAATASGGGPDFVTMGVEQLPRYYEMGVIQPIDNFESLIDPGVLPQAFVPYLKKDGKYIAFPMGLFSECLYYNKDMFKAAGLDPEKPPANWDEMIDYAVKLTKDKNGNTEQYGLALAAKESVPNWQILIWGNGGDVIDSSNKNSVINSPQNVETVKKFADLVLNKHISPPAPTGLEVSQLFNAGKTAMMMGGPWEKTGFQTAKINFGVAQIPAGPKADVTYGGGTFTILTKSGVAKKDAVDEYLKYWMSKETQIQWSLNSGYPPARTDILNDPAFKNDDVVQQFAKGLEHAKFYNVDLPGAERIDKEGWAPAFEAILLQKADVQKTLDKAASTIDGILKQ